MPQQAHFLSAFQPSLLATSWHTPQPSQRILIVCSNLLDKTCPYSSSRGNWTACPEFFTGTNLPKAEYSPIYESISGLYTSVVQPTLHRFHLIVTELSWDTRQKAYKLADLHLSSTPELSKPLEAAPPMIQKWKTCVPKQQSGSTDREIHKRRREGRKKNKKKNPTKVIDLTHWIYWRLRLDLMNALHPHRLWSWEATAFM